MYEKSDYKIVKIKRDNISDISSNRSPFTIIGAGYSHNKSIIAQTVYKIEDKNVILIINNKKNTKYNDFYKNYYID